ncbi:MAG: hypothetical protein AVDCRST_MAG50-1975, partial [uncultured Acidimicrobiales bacterium]
EPLQDPAVGRARRAHRDRP